MFSTLKVENAGKLPGTMRLRADAGGLLDEGATDEDASSWETPSVVPRHKVLVTSFELKSKAFMCTHNSRAFAPETWSRYRAWARSFARDKDKAGCQVKF